MFWLVFGWLIGGEWCVYFVCFVLIVIVIVIGVVLGFVVYLVNGLVLLLFEGVLCIVNGVVDLSVFVIILFGFDEVFYFKVL